MSTTRCNKFREAIEILQRGREVLVENLADEVLAQADDLIDGGFTFNEFLEGQGTRIHFLCLLVAQLEQSAEALDEAMAPPPPPPPAEPKKPRRSRSKKLTRQASESPAEES